MFAQIHDSSLESVKHIFKNNKSGQTIFFFFKIIGPRYEGFRQFFFFGGLGHDLGPNRGMAGGARWVWG